VVLSRFFRFVVRSRKNLRIAQTLNLWNAPVFPVLDALDAAISEPKKAGQSGGSAEASDQYGVWVEFAHAPIKHHV
jgi:hypothetical protein